MRAVVYSVVGLVAVAGMMDEPLFTVVMVVFIVVLPLGLYFLLRKTSEALAYVAGTSAVVGGITFSWFVWEVIPHEPSEGLVMFLIALVLAGLSLFAMRICAESA